MRSGCHSEELRIVVLGTGFIGSALLAELRERQMCAAEGYNSRTLDLNAPDAVDRLSRAVDAETVLVFTATALRPGSPFTLEGFSADLEMSMNLARTLTKQHVKKCVYFSTASVYNDQRTDLAITEETPIAPASLYGLARYTGEGLVQHASERTGVPLVVLRPCKTYGPGDQGRLYGPNRFVDSLLRSGKVELFGDGLELRDHLYIDDLVKLTIWFALGNRAGTYNVATGRSRPFQDQISCLRRLVGRDFEVVQLPRSRPKIDQQFNPARLLDVLPDFPFTELEEGMLKTYRSFTAPLVRS